VWIYEQLRLASERNYPVRWCPCGAPLFADDPRRRFCGPWPGYRESACRKKFQTKRLRKYLPSSEDEVT
jgi:hypothetical protein